MPPGWEQRRARLGWRWALVTAGLGAAGADKELWGWNLGGSPGAAQDHGDTQPVGSEYLRRWRLYSLSDQPMPEFDQSHSRKCVFLCSDATSYFFICAHCWTPLKRAWFPLRCTLPFKYFSKLLRSPRPSLPSRLNSPSCPSFSPHERCHALSPVPARTCCLGAMCHPPLSSRKEVSRTGPRGPILLSLSFGQDAPSPPAGSAALPYQAAAPTLLHPQTPLTHPRGTLSPRGAQCFQQGPGHSSLRVPVTPPTSPALQEDAGGFPSPTKQL